MIKTRYPTGSKRRFKWIYSSARWKALRASIFRERGKKCERCQSLGEVQLHHKVPVASGGEIWDETNLILLCRSCHLEAHRKIEASKIPDWQRRLYALVEQPVVRMTQPSPCPRRATP